MSLLCAITIQFTNFHHIHPGITMRKQTQEIRFQELIKDIKNHPHKEELLLLMNEQVADDTLRID